MMGTFTAMESFISHYHAARPIDWLQQYQNSLPLEVEIGCGLGEFLAQRASSYPDRNFVGIELEWERVKKTLRKIERLKDNSPAGHFTNNIRVLHVDATVALERLFRPRTISRMTSLFPCPWPKKKHAKHRLFSREFLTLMNSRLVQDGEVCIVTDDRPYFEWMVGQSEDTGFKKQIKKIQPQFHTKYERKWCREGQQEFFALDLMKREHRDVPLQEDAAVQSYYVDDFDPDRFHFHDIKGDISIIMKDFLYDPRRRKSMLHVVVAEKSMIQHVWIGIARCRTGWCIFPGEGQAVLPTKGIARALYHVYQEVQRINGKVH